MPRTFRLVSDEAPGALVAMARRTVIGNGASFKGNETTGSFSASGVMGVYRMQGKVLTVTITRKPFYVSWPRVEFELKRLLALELRPDRAPAGVGPPKRKVGAPGGGRRRGSLQGGKNETARRRGGGGRKDR